MDPRVLVGKMNIVHMQEHARLERRRNLQYQVVAIATEPHAMGTVVEQDVARLKFEKHVSGLRTLRARPFETRSFDFGAKQTAHASVGQAARFRLPDRARPHRQNGVVEIMVVGRAGLGPATNGSKVRCSIG